MDTPSEAQLSSSTVPASYANQAAVVDGVSSSLNQGHESSSETPAQSPRRSSQSAGSTAAAQQSTLFIEKQIGSGQLPASNNVDQQLSVHDGSSDSADQPNSGSDLTVSAAEHSADTGVTESTEGRNALTSAQQAEETSPEADDSILNVNFQYLDGRTFTLELPSDIDISDVVSLAAESAELPEERVRLIYRGRALQTGHSLEHYNVQTGHTVHVVLNRLANATTASASAAASTSTSTAARATGNTAPGLNGSTAQWTPIALPGGATMMVGQLQLPAMNYVASIGDRQAVPSSSPAGTTGGTARTGSQSQLPHPSGTGGRGAWITPAGNAGDHAALISSIINGISHAVPAASAAVSQMTGGTHHHRIHHHPYRPTHQHRQRGERRSSTGGAGERQQGGSVPARAAAGTTAAVAASGASTGVDAHRTTADSSASASAAGRQPEPGASTTAAGSREREASGGVSRSSGTQQRGSTRTNLEISEEEEQQHERHLQRFYASIGYSLQNAGESLIRAAANLREDAANDIAALAASRAQSRYEAAAFADARDRSTSNQASAAPGVSTASTEGGVATTRAAADTSPAAAEAGAITAEGRDAARHEEGGESSSASGAVSAEMGAPTAAQKGPVESPQQPPSETPAQQQRQPQEEEREEPQEERQQQQQQQESQQTQLTQQQPMMVLAGGMRASLLPVAVHVSLHEEDLPPWGSSSSSSSSSGSIHENDFFGDSGSFQASATRPAEGLVQFGSPTDVTIAAGQRATGGDRGHVSITHELVQRMLPWEELQATLEMLQQETGFVASEPPVISTRPGATPPLAIFLPRFFAALNLLSALGQQYTGWHAGFSQISVPTVGRTAASLALLSSTLGNLANLFAALFSLMARQANPTALAEAMGWSVQSAQEQAEDQGGGSSSENSAPSGDDDEEEGGSSGGAGLSVRRRPGEARAAASGGVVEEEWLRRWRSSRVVGVGEQQATKQQLTKQQQQQKRQKASQGRERGLLRARSFSSSDDEEADEEAAASVRPRRRLRGAADGSAAVFLQAAGSRQQEPEARGGRGGGASSAAAVLGATESLLAPALAAATRVAGHQQQSTQEGEERKRSADEECSEGFSSPEEEEEVSSVSAKKTKKSKEDGKTSAAGRKLSFLRKNDWHSEQQKPPADDIPSHLHMLTSSSYCSPDKEGSLLLNRDFSPKVSSAPASVVSMVSNAATAGSSGSSSSEAQNEDSQTTLLLSGGTSSSFRHQKRRQSEKLGEDDAGPSSSTTNKSRSSGTAVSHGDYHDDEEDEVEKGLAKDRKKGSESHSPQQQQQHCLSREDRERRAEASPFSLFCSRSFRKKDDDGNEDGDDDADDVQSCYSLKDETTSEAAQEDSAAGSWRQRRLGPAPLSAKTSPAAASGGQRQTLHLNNKNKEEEEVDDDLVSPAPLLAAAGGNGGLTNTSTALPITRSDHTSSVRNGSSSSSHSSSGRGAARSATPIEEERGEGALSAPAAVVVTGNRVLAAAAIDQAPSFSQTPLQQQLPQSSEILRVSPLVQQRFAHWTGDLQRFSRNILSFARPRPFSTAYVSGDVTRTPGSTLRGTGAVDNLLPLSWHRATNRANVGGEPAPPRQLEADYMLLLLRDATTIAAGNVDYQLERDRFPHIGLALQLLNNPSSASSASESTEPATTNAVNAVATTNDTVNATAAAATSNISNAGAGCAQSSVKNHRLEQQQQQQERSTAP